MGARPRGLLYDKRTDSSQPPRPFVTVWAVRSSEPDANQRASQALFTRYYLLLDALPKFPVVHEEAPSDGGGPEVTEGSEHLEGAPFHLSERWRKKQNGKKNVQLKVWDG